MLTRLRKLVTRYSSLVPYRELVAAAAVGCVAVAGLAQPPNRAAVLLPPRPLDPSEPGPIARGAIDDAIPLSTTPVTRSQKPPTGPAWLYDSNVVPAGNSAAMGQPSRLQPVAGQTVLDANRKLSEQGLRVLAFAVRRFEPGEAVPADPMDGVKDLTLIGLVGIIDPLRPSSKEAVRIAHAAGIDVRMLTGDHAITAAAIGSKLGLGRGAASGADIQAMTDDELKAALPNLHVFGRVTPEDKLRLARLMQENGDVVANVIADNACGVAVGRVRDLDPDRGRAVDYVVVREDLTGRGQDDACARRGAVCETELRLDHDGSLPYPRDPAEARSEYAACGSRARHAQ